MLYGCHNINIRMAVDMLLPESRELTMALARLLFLRPLSQLPLPGISYTLFLLGFCVALNNFTPDVHRLSIVS